MSKNNPFILVNKQNKGILLCENYGGKEDRCWYLVSFYVEILACIINVNML